LNLRAGMHKMAMAPAIYKKRRFKSPLPPPSPGYG
jgi:hypothetical protein